MAAMLGWLTQHTKITLSSIGIFRGIQPGCVQIIHLNLLQYEQCPTLIHSAVLFIDTSTKHTHSLIGVPYLTIIVSSNHFLLQFLGD